LFLIINLFWSIRLSHFLLYTRVLKAGEDGRYLALRNYWGAKAQINFLFFFLAQAVLVAIMSTGFFAVTENLQFSLFRAIFAILVFLVSLVGTSISDMQLESFRQNPVNKGQVCEVGLWYYSRHPNYFFETLHWFVYPILAWGGDYFWISCLLPLLMIYLITKVSGIPYTEMQALRSRGEAYKKYQESTSVFIPWFKRN
jgi:steroid 5-alpha reductase family enzyme